MKAWVRGELAGHIWEDNELLGRISPSLKADVLDAVGQSHSKPNVVDYFPNTEAGERAFYPGFARLFNEMAKAYRKKSKLTSRSRSAVRDPFYSDTDNLFCPIEEYDRETLHGAIEGNPLKPDLVIPLTSSDGGRYRWDQISVACEVKGEWDHLVTQAATHARALFSAHPSRAFTVVIAFNHKTLEARLLAFHRSGMHSTPAVRIARDGDWDDLTGFAQIVAAVVELQAGLSTWIDPQFHRKRLTALSLSIPKSIDIRTLYNRITIVGRLTKLDEISYHLDPSSAELMDSEPNPKKRRLSTPRRRECSRRPRTVTN
jgi:hypothetical protein